MNNFSRSCLDNHLKFRLVLQAMSRPGRIVQLPGVVTDDRDHRALLLNLLDTLLDPQVSYCLLDSDPQLELEVQLQTGARPATPETADFLLAATGTSHCQLLRAKRGRRDFPDQGATILYCVRALKDGTATNGLPLRGPGIKDVIYPLIEGWDAEEPERLGEVNREYPLGVDSILVDRRGRLLCIPRSTAIGRN